MIEITTYTLSTDGLESNDWRSAVTIKIDGIEDDPVILTFHDGEPEDNSLGRNFADVMLIPNLIASVIEKGSVISSIITYDVEVDSIDQMPSK